MDSPLLRRERGHVKSPYGKVGMGSLKITARAGAKDSTFLYDYTSREVQTTAFQVQRTSTIVQGPEGVALLEDQQAPSGTMKLADVREFNGWL